MDHARRRLCDRRYHHVRAQPRRVDSPWRERWRTDRRSFLAGSIDALITGIGLGMVAVLVIVLLTGALVRLGL